MANEQMKAFQERAAALDPEIVLEMWESKVVPDMANVAAKVNDAKGPSRTMAQFADDCGTSASTLSRIVNMKNTRPMSIELMLAVVEKKAPTSDLTIVELLRANGYRPTIELKKEDLNWEDVDKDKLLESIKKEMQERELLNNRARSIKNLLSNELLIRGATVSVHGRSFDEDEDIGELAFSFGLAAVWDILYRVNILGEYECWVIGIVPVTTEDNDSEEYLEDMTWAVLKNFSPLFVTDQWESETLKGKKVTIVFSDEKLMNAVQEKLSNARFNNSFSLMLVDLHKVVIVKEVPLLTNGTVKYESILDVKRKELDTVKGNWMQLGAVAFPDTALE